MLQFTLYLVPLCYISAKIRNTWIAIYNTLASEIPSRTSFTRRKQHNAKRCLHITNHLGTCSEATGLTGELVELSKREQHNIEIRSRLKFTVIHIVRACLSAPKAQTLS